MSAAAASRRAVRIALTAAALLVVALGALVTLRRPLAAALIERALARSGFSEPRVDVESLSLAGLVIASIDAGDALHVGRVEAEFDLRRLPSLPVSVVRVRGARVRMLPQVAAPGTSAPSAEAAELPLAILPTLELDDVALEVPSPLGAATVRLASRVRRDDVGALRMSLDGTVEAPGAGTTLRVEARLDPGGAVSMDVNASALRVASGGLAVDSGTAHARLDVVTRGTSVRSAGGRAEITIPRIVAGGKDVGGVSATALLAATHEAGVWAATLREGDLRLPGQRLRLAGVEGAATAGTLEIHVARIEDTGTDRRFEPLSVHGERDGTGPIRADVSAASGRATLRIEARRAADGSAVADVVLPRTDLRPGRLQPTDLSPRLASLGPVAGTIDGAATIRWKRGAPLEVEGALGLDGVSAVVGGTAIEGLSGRTAIAGLAPPRTAGTQSLRIARLNPGVEITDLSVGWALEPLAEAPGSRLRLDRLSAAFAGGRLLVDDALLFPHGRNRIVFRFEDVDVERLFAIASLEGVSGTGRLAGSVPVTVEDGAVAIDDGALESTNGVLRIDSKQAARLLAGGGQSIDLLLRVLRDFHYERLVVQMKKALGGSASVTVRLQGSNPAVLEGYPFRINLNVSGDLDRLVGSLLEVARLSDRAVRATVRAMR